MYYLGLDVGGTNIKAGLIDENAANAPALKSRTTPTEIDDLKGFISKLTELIRDFQKSAPIKAVGIGVPGLRSSKTRTIQTSPNIPCLTNVNVEELVAEEVHLKVVTENDANAGAYAEFLCGAGVGLHNLAYLTLGTGLGSGLVLNGSLYTGTSGYGPEFGHTIVDPQGRICGCGQRGCLETLVSATGIVMTARDKLKTGSASSLREVSPPLTAEKIYGAAVRGDEVAREVFAETGRWLGIGCANLINFLNLEMIIIGGGVMASGELLLGHARDFARLYAFPPSFADSRIVQSRLWPDAGMIGAALLARDRIIWGQT
jgi:glucokinase